MTQVGNQESPESDFLKLPRIRSLRAKHTETNKITEMMVIKEIMTTVLNVIMSCPGEDVDVGEVDKDDPDEEATVGGRVIVDFTSSGEKKLIPSPNRIS